LQYSRNSKKPLAGRAHSTATVSGQNMSGEAREETRKKEDWTMDKKNKYKATYRVMITLAIIVGGAGIILQFIPDFEFFSFFLALSVMGGLIGGSNDYDERDRQQLERSYKKSFEWLLLIILAAYAFIEFSRWLIPFRGTAVFLNSHWPGLVISVMCALMGIAGLQITRSKDSANKATGYHPDTVEYPYSWAL
jgi:hypothetical protein